MIIAIIIFFMFFSSYLLINIIAINNDLKDITKDRNLYEKSKGDFNND